jgi:hypothetical protein
MGYIGGQATGEVVLAAKVTHVPSLLGSAITFRQAEPAR